MANLTEDQKKNIREVQTVLMNIEAKRDIFFNVQVYKNMGVIKEYGKTIDNKTNWVLTEKGKRILSVVV